ncbi:unnamed protein product [Oikopleura dioica]|nr:unnamed protein product [Oikopleura dioica]
MTDETSYLEVFTVSLLCVTTNFKVEIPKKRIFTISKKGVVKNSDPSLQKIFSTTYDSMAEIVDFFFPQRSMTASTSSLQHLDNKFWRDDLPEIDFCEDVFTQESGQQQSEHNVSRSCRTYFEERTQSPSFELAGLSLNIPARDAHKTVTPENTK